MPIIDPIHLPYSLFLFFRRIHSLILHVKIIFYFSIIFDIVLKQSVMEHRSSIYLKYVWIE